MPDKIKSLLVGLVLFGGFAASAEPLGAIPRVQEGDPRLVFELLSDLWVNPDQNKESPIRIYDARMILPYLKTEQWQASIDLKASACSIGEPDLVVGKDAIRIGSDLRSQSVGLGLGHRGNDGSWLNVFANYNSASDEPFKSSRDSWAGGSAVYGFASEGNEQWLLGVDYSRNRGWLNDHAIPLVGRQFQLAPDFVVAVGFPFFYAAVDIVHYLSVHLTVTPVGVHGEFIHDVNDKLSLRIRGGLATRSYLHTARVHEDDRLFINSNYVATAFRRVLSERTSFGFELGYSFRRKLYEGQQVFRPVGVTRQIANDLTGGFVMEFKL